MASENLSKVLSKKWRWWYLAPPSDNFYRTLAPLEGLKGLKGLAHPESASTCPVHLTGRAIPGRARQG